MKLTKKLIPALGMLVLSACMLVTSTFAWFSMNTTVTATNMTVSAKADQVYLQIVKGNDKTEFKNNEKQTSVNANASISTLQPANVVKSFDKATFVPFDAGCAADNAHYWVSNTSDSVENGARVQDYKVADPAVSYLKVDFMIRLNESAGKSEATGALKATSVTFTLDEDGNAAEYVKSFANCVSVLVVCKEYNTESQKYDKATGAQLFKQVKNDIGNFTLETGDEYLNASSTNAEGKSVFANTEGVLIEVYVFFDGENENCTIANLLAAQAASETAYTVDVNFSCQ